MSKLTQPGNSDLHYMTVVCTPEATAVTFHEFRDIDGENGAAVDAAREALAAPRTSAYVGLIELHGNTGRPASAVDDLVLVPVRLDPELRVHLAKRGMRGRKDIVGYLTGLLVAAQALDREALDRSAHQRAAAPAIECHGGRRCGNWPTCESCGPARQ